MTSPRPNAGSDAGLQHLFFATNRNHLGESRWQPSGYGKHFSKDGTDNLRFGRLQLGLEESQLEDYIEGEHNGRIGDGTGLAGFIGQRAQTAQIHACEDLTHSPELANGSQGLSEQDNASASLFREIKGQMEQGHDLVVYIHGYNVSWEDAVGGALALQLMLNRNLERQAGDDTSAAKQVRVLLFSWPSDGQGIPWRSYSSDRKDARHSGEAIGRGLLKLRDFLASLRRDSKAERDRECGQQLHLLCHSMGNYVMQNALQKMQQHISDGRLPRLFEHIFLCAADIDDDELEAGQAMSRLPELARRVHIYNNHDDGALIISDYTKGQPDRLGHQGLARPQLAHQKLSQIDCTAIVGRDQDTQHSYYLWASANQDIAQSIAGQACDAPDRGRQRASSQYNLWTLT